MNRPHFSKKPEMRTEENWIWGFHSVEAALENCPELVVDLQVESQLVDNSLRARKNEDLASEPKVLSKIIQLAKKQSIKIKTVPQLPRALSDRRTQGVVAKLKRFPQIWWKDFKDELVGALEEGAISQFAILDGIQDTRNFGAILRSAAAFGVKAVFVRDRRQAPVNGVVAQASAGNVFRVPLVVCSSLQNVVDEFSNRDFAVLGLEAGKENLAKAVSRGKTPILWILGGEAEGIRSTLREKCKTLVSIPMQDGVESLNASAAASLAFYVGAERNSASR